MACKINNFNHPYGYGNNPCGGCKNATLDAMPVVRDTKAGKHELPLSQELCEKISGNTTNARIMQMNAAKE